MEKIIKNGKEFLRFRIGDEFTSKSSRQLFSDSMLKEIYSGDITFNKMKNFNLAQNKKDDIYQYPFLDSSILNNHIKGYSKIKNFSGSGIKISESGDAGKAILICGDYFIGRPAYILINNKLSNEYLALFFNNYLPKFKQTGVISNLMYGYVKNNGNFDFFNV